MCDMRPNIGTDWSSDCASDVYDLRFRWDPVVYRFYQRNYPLCVRDLFTKIRDLARAVATGEVGAPLHVCIGHSEMKKYRWAISQNRQNPAPVVDRWCAW